MGKTQKKKTNMRRVINTVRRMTRRSTANLKPSCLEPSPAATSINKERLSFTQGVSGDTFTVPEIQEQQQQPKQQDENPLEVAPVEEQEEQELATAVVIGTVVEDTINKTNLKSNIQTEKLENTASS